MSEQNKLPSDDDIQNTIERAEVIVERLEEYRERAEAIDAAYLRRNEHRTPTLDDMPYGEELIRTKSLPEELNIAIKELISINSGARQGDDALAAFESARETIKDAEDTLEDCTPVEDEDEDED